MKITEINKLIKKHVEKNLSNYSIHRDLIYKLDNVFFIKGYYFESRGNDDLDLAVWYFIQPLFVKKEAIVLTLGERLSYKNRVSLLRAKEFEWWDARKENWDITFESISATIKEKGERQIGKEISPELFYKRFYPNKEENIRIYEALAYSVVLFGSMDLQNQIIKGLIDFCTSQIDCENDVVEMQIKKDAIFLLDAGTTEARVKILKSWANETIEHLKLPHIPLFGL
jgi:hypothetical protein